MKTKFKRPKEAEQGSDLGFGTKNIGEGRRGLNKNGSFNVIRKGIPFFNSFETYHSLISMSWIRFSVLVITLYISVNLLFAALYMLIGIDNLAGIKASTNLDKFLESFFFSSQTITTVGYGRISPSSHLASITAAVESLVGLLGFAVITGLLYGRFSRPQARIKYSDNAVIAPYKNITALMFRIVNERKNQLIEVEAAVSLSMKHPENPNLRSFFNLKLEITKINFFPLSWTVVHPIDENSPLWGLTEEELNETDAEFISLIKAFDDTFSQTVYSRSSYKCTEVAWGAKFIPMMEYAPKGTILNIDKINVFEKIALPVMQLEKEIVQD